MPNGVWSVPEGRFLVSDELEDVDCGSLTRGQFATFGDWRLGATNAGYFGFYHRATSDDPFSCQLVIDSEVVVALLLGDDTVYAGESLGQDGWWMDQITSCEGR